MQLELTYLSCGEQTIKYPSKKVAGQTDEYVKRTVQALDNENKIFLFTPTDLTPYMRLQPFTKITVSLTYNPERGDLGQDKVVAVEQPLIRNNGVSTPGLDVDADLTRP